MLLGNASCGELWFYLRETKLVGRQARMVGFWCWLRRRWLPVVLLPLTLVCLGHQCRLLLDLLVKQHNFQTVAMKNDKTTRHYTQRFPLWVHLKLDNMWSIIINDYTINNMAPNRHYSIFVWHVLVAHHMHYSMANELRIDELLITHETVIYQCPVA